ncbi:transposase [Arachnia propionica]|uniref:transposase n=1 Tax=Arachnia propionica TaxID=1750 RepID=UPI000F6B6DC9|nr:transposase [Arachnia propionica]VEJ58644.1 Transposase and inactivated derivatives [Arachnia propionica]
MTVTTASSSSSAVESARLGVVALTPPPPVEGLAELGKAQREVIAQMVPQAEDAGIALTGPGGLRKALTAQVVETVLDEELNERLGYDEHDPVGRGTGNSRNGTWSKTVITDNVGTIQIEVPRDRKMVFSLLAKGADDR